MLYKLLSLLLQYPNRELYQALPVLQSDVKTGKNLTSVEQQVLFDWLSWAGSQALMDWQSCYVDTFDFSPENCLYLTYHLYKDDRDRGLALVELSEHYQQAGFDLSQSKELPDYLPVILEYTSSLDATEAQFFLHPMLKVVQTMVDNLQKLSSPYATLLQLLVEHNHLSKKVA